MNRRTLKIIECFNITGIGFMTEVQHFEQGIPPNTKIIHPKSRECWIVKKRVLSGLLLVDNSETYFECETEVEHISHSFRLPELREKAIQEELKKRSNNIYWYLLSPEIRTQKEKPGVGDIFEILL